jgi:hypothetical protein
LVVHRTGRIEEPSPCPVGDGDGRAEGVERLDNGVVGSRASDPAAERGSSFLRCSELILENSLSRGFVIRSFRDCKKLRCAQASCEGETNVDHWASFTLNNCSYEMAAKGSAADATNAPFLRCPIHGYVLRRDGEIFDGERRLKKGEQ